MPGTAIRQLAISCFRSLRRVHIETGGHSVVLHGRNGVGKTNVLEAVSMLSPGRGLRSARAAEMVRSGECTGWRISGQIDLLSRGQHAPHGHEVETRFDGSGRRDVVVDGKPAPQSALGRVLPLMWLVPVMDRLWLEGSEGRRRFLDRMAMGFEPDHAERSLVYARALRERNGMLKAGVGDSVWYDAIELRMAEAGAAIEANRQATIDRLVATGGQIGSGFPRAELSLVSSGGEAENDGSPDLARMSAACDALDETISPGEAASMETGAADWFRDCFRKWRSGDILSGRTRNGPHRTDLLAVHAGTGLPARQCSTGEQKALLLSLILAGARAQSEDTGIGTTPVLLLDEVSAHLDESRRGELYHELERLGAQVWMTGTEPELFASLAGDFRKFSVVSEGGETRIAAD